MENFISCAMPLSPVVLANLTSSDFPHVFPSHISNTSA